MIVDPSPRTYDVIVLGAGAAGLMCAITAATRGRRVVVLERANRIGKKILMSGGGRCNFTHLATTAENFLSANPHFCKSALARFTPYDFLAMVEAHGIGWHEKTPGQLFCNRSSKDIVAMLAEQCSQHHAEIRTRCDISAVRGDDAGFQVDSNLGRFTAARLVVATGGLSIPRMGATGFGYALAEQFGLAVRPTRAGLVPFTLGGGDRPVWSDLAGVSACVVAETGGARWHDDVLVTHRGLSGPAMLQLSSYWQPGEAVHINWLGEPDGLAWLAAQRETRPRQQLGNVLATRLSSRLAEMLCQRHLGAMATMRMADLSATQLAAASQAICAMDIVPDGTEGYRTAEVTLGGVETDALSSRTMEARDVPGLHFVGEVVDVTGWLGGYNFQWAWASGYAAGLAV